MSLETRSDVILSPAMPRSSSTIPTWILARLSHILSLSSLKDMLLTLLMMSSSSAALRRIMEPSSLLRRNPSVLSSKKPL